MPRPGHLSPTAELRSPGGVHPRGVESRWGLRHMEGETEARGGSPDRAEEAPAGLCNKEAQDGCFLPSLGSLVSLLPSFFTFLFCFLPFLPFAFSLPDFVLLNFISS